MQYFPYGTMETEALKAADPILGAAIDRLGHPDRPLMPDLFTALVNCVIAQQISTKAAETVYGRVVDRCGGAVTPEQIARFSEEEIQSLGMSRRKAGYIRGIAFAFVSGQIDARKLREADEDRIIRELTALPGIGIWTAEMLMLHSLQHPDICSWHDLGIRRGMMRLYGMETVSKKEFEELRRRYSPYGSVASIYLWALAHQ
ncbi:DNA-3-methyladenine glycosylase family protein [Methanocorpusculum vombati]|uniref:DNA-3-methyladenine glycosylase n=1 Tax=Methanocorpusculum vombati TaxID=3002864 RepID=A0ABT4IM25_9EURY|nr:DNA-3-methyladenine glycosylase [Methanocorpusculum vombati]MCZ9319696.1 DNA-3-methyladenine glycosylase [Methanocorpusculum sp.]MCZ0862802.1 DNA-3-methyladenine glycosylase [Methanocorpusculum vombati]MDE2519994.1 DNA-3-methyladenine glycosylase [Methanocorpusculum sp.]MDE2533778.1 DNA-3-methyladenine glycosylase [Methanocorpusculum sp.]MDE2546618.1 DNA-3-methyladenine glycosylase [Methanocorpusculum sp.]